MRWRFRTINLVMLIAVVFIVLFQFLLYEHYVRRQVNSLLIDSVRQTLYRLSFHVNNYLNGDGRENLHIVFDRTNASSKEIADLYVIDVNGTVLLTTNYAYDKKGVAVEHMLPLRQLSPENIAQTDAVFLNVYRLKGLQRIPYRLSAILDKDYVADILTDTRQIMYYIPALFLVIMILFYLLLYYNVIKPVLQLSRYVRGVSQLLPDTMVAEIADLRDTVREQMEKLHEMAYLDSLTGVQNRRSIERSLDLAIAAAKRDEAHFNIALLDLDNFKTINDTYGHDAGDMLLREMVHRLRSHLREVDQIGRLGGDEFLILFHHDRNLSGNKAVLERIRTLFEEPFEIAGDFVVSTVSVGVATFPKDGKTRHELIKAADRAMYRVKKSGGNRVFKH